MIPAAIALGTAVPGAEAPPAPGGAPVPASRVITRLEWAPAETITRQCIGSDNFPITWADDGELYTTYGDGWGFEPRLKEKLGLGFARVVGTPEKHHGENIRSPAENTGSGRSGKKGSGLLMVDGVLYLWLFHADEQGGQAQLAWSRDHARTWTSAAWKFAEFGLCTFVHFGQDYAGARDGYVYAVSHDGPKADTPADRFILMRVPKERVADRAAYEFFRQRDPRTGDPVWTSDVAQRGAVFSHPGRCLRSGISYNAGLRRYLWWQHLPNFANPRDRGDTRFEGGFGIYDAPEPWGPWTCVYFTEHWDVGPGERAEFPPKWMSADGRTLHLTFSGEDSFSVRRATLTVAEGEGATTAPYPRSRAIRGVEFDLATTKQQAPGSDNWVITWADDGHQYVSWGDGGGFGGTNEDGRSSLGFGRVEGPKDAYTVRNVWGGRDPEHPAQFAGKCYGLLSVGGIFYMWRTGPGLRGDHDAFALQQLYRSKDHAATWEPTGIRFTPESFRGSYGFFAPTLLNFGRDYQGARDGYVYTYAPEVKDPRVWDVQCPGEIALMRAPKERVGEPDALEFFAGPDTGGAPTWTRDVNARAPVFRDAANGVMRASVSYNPGLRRYLLVVQQASRSKFSGGLIGIYDAPEPWGPWTTVLLESPWKLGINEGYKTVFWNFSSKWLSPDGRRFVMVYTGPTHDNWGSVEGRFIPIAD